MGQSVVLQGSWISLCLLGLLACSAGGAATKIAFAALFATSSVDVVALQDGVGARGLSVQQIGANLAYYRAMLDACKDKCEV